MLPRILGVGAAAFVVVILVVSSLGLNPRAAAGGSSQAQPATTALPPPATPFYPYLPSPTIDPTPDVVASALTNASAPFVIPATAGCSSAATLSLSTPVEGYLSPSGCALYSLAISQTQWNTAQTSGGYLDVMETDAGVQGPGAAFTLYAGMAQNPSPSNYLAVAHGPSAALAVSLANDTATVWGGWGTYLVELQAGSVNYGSYCLELKFGGQSPTSPSCTSFMVEGSITGGSASLSVKFTGTVLNAGPSLLSSSWTFGDGTPNGSATATHTYAQAGNYTVKFTATLSTFPQTQASVAYRISVGASNPTLSASLPRSGTGWISGDSRYLLVQDQAAPGGRSFLTLQSGQYAPVVASEIVQGTASQHLPIQWGAPTTIAAFSGPITGDAFTVADNGTVLFAAAASNGTTVAFMSTNSGGTWDGLTNAPVAGGAPGMAVAPFAVVLTTVTASSTVTSDLSLRGQGGGTATLVGTPTQEFTEWTPGVASGTIDVLATEPNGSVMSFASVDNGFLYHASRVGTYVSASISSYLHAVGGTALADPTGVAGDIAVSTEGSEVVAVYTTSLNGRIVADVVTSPDGGEHWFPEETITLPIGSISGIASAASAAGYVYLALRTDALTTPSLFQGVLLSDGGIAQNVSLIGGTMGRVGPRGPPSLGGAGIAITVDGFQRAVVIWTGPTGPSGATPLEATGTFLTPTQATNFAQSSYDALSAPDFKGGGTPFCPMGRACAPSSGSSSQLKNTILTLKSNVTSLSSVLAPSAPTNHTTATAQNDTAAEVYGAITTVPLVVDSSSSSAWADLQPALHPSGSILATTGQLSPNTYLSVAGDWLLESLGVQVDVSGDSLAQAGIPANGLVPIGPALPPIPPTYVSSSATVDGLSASQSATAMPMNPTTGRLQLASSFPTYTSGGGTLCQQGSDYEHATFSLSDAPASIGKLTVTVEGVSGSVSNGATVYLTNLEANATIGWSVSSLTATYAETETITGCGSTTTSSVPVSSGWPSSIKLASMSGTLVTDLRMVPGSGAGTFVLVLPPSGTQTGLQVNMFWNNTMLGEASSTLNSNTVSYLQAIGTGGTWGIPEHFAYNGVTSGTTVTAAMSAWSQVGAWNSTQTPGVSANEDLYANPQTTGTTCSFQVLNNPVTISGLGAIVDQVNNSATIVWNATQLGTSWVRFYELDTGMNYTETATSAANGADWEYTANVHGLSSFGLYGVGAWTTYVPAGSCAAYAANSATVFLTYGGFGISESDNAYDSITHEGGGASIRWAIPPGLVTYGQFLQGYFTYVNNTAHPASGAFSFGAQSPEILEQGPQFVANLSLQDLNTSYTVSALLNFTVTWHSQSWTRSAWSQPTTFLYLRDTSGDGLTDVEKVLGWQVAYTNLQGSTVEDHVQANPLNWSTNGLVNDFIEKEYGLNPGTVDSASSHMLDTWNLTFNLGTSGWTVPSGANFEYWNEPSYNPFATSVEYAPGEWATGTPLTPVGTIEDSGPSAANTLWSYSALQSFVRLPGVLNASWLRAVEGKDGSTYTLTVWGKLSWGANPLATSTPGDGVADGARVNPLGGTDLQVTINSWTLSSTTVGSGMASQTAAAAYIFATSAADSYSSAATDYAAFSSPVLTTSTGPTTTNSLPGPFVVTFSVTPTEQSVSLNVTLDVNETVWATSHSLTYAHAVTMPSQSVDLMNVAGGTWSQTTSGLAMQVSWVPVTTYAKAPTWIYIPSGNSTLSQLPLGLQRYTGDQHFILLEVDYNTSAVSGGQSVPGIYYPNSTAGTYSNFSLGAGLNNILIPRSEFINSPLGQALLGNSSTVSVASTTWTSPFGNHFTASTWYDRATTGNGYAPATPSAPDPGYIQVYTSTSQSSSSSTALGGSPTNPALSGQYSSIAVGAVYAINITSTSDLASLAEGILANGTGNMTGWLDDATAHLASLGLLSAVSSALATATFQNDGGFNYPVSRASPPPPPPPPPPPWWEAPAVDLWNAATGVVDAVVNAVTEIVSVAWNSVVAAASYLGDFVAKAAAWGLSEISQAASSLQSVLNTLISLVYELINLIKQAIIAMIDAVVSPIKAAFDNFADAIESDLWSAVNDSGNSAALQTDGLHFWSDFTGPLFDAALALAIVVTIAITVADVVSFGAGDILTIVLGAVAGVAITAVFILLGLTSAVEVLGSTMVNAVKSDIEGATKFSPRPGLHVASVAPPGWDQTWDAVSNAITIGWDLPTVLVNFGLLAGGLFLAKPGGNYVLGTEVGFAVAIVATILDVAALTVPLAAVASEILTVGDLFADAFIFTEDPPPDLETLDEISTGLDISAAVIGGATLLADWEADGRPT
jgi:hypothetical protein